MDTQKWTLTATFTSELLGSQPQKEVASEYIKATARDAGLDVEDELATLPEMLEKGTTAFNKVNGAPVLFDYQVKGFIKESGSLHNGTRGVKNLKNKIDNMLFVFPRIVPLSVPQGGGITFLERPLRAQTAQGPRVALARSEMLPVGTAFQCELRVLGTQLSEPLLRELLDYGALKGIGQWRNGSYGRFEYTLEAVA